MEKDLSKDEEQVEEKSEGKKLTQGRVIKVIEDLDFGVLETEDSDFLFFHISSFKEEDIKIEDIKEGDVIMCEREVQESDGRAAAINCQRIKLKGYLKDYFIENALVAPGNVEMFDEFVENAEEYATYLKDADISMEMAEGMDDKIIEAETVMDLKMLRPSLAILTAKNKDNTTFVEFMEIIDSIIKNLAPSSEDDIEIKNFKNFIQIIMSYTQIV